MVIIRQAGESGSLYGSVAGRDIAIACGEAGLTVTREQVLLGQPLKNIGIATVQVELHPEVHIPVVVNVARSREEAEKQARGESAAAAAEAAATRAGTDPAAAVVSVSAVSTAANLVVGLSATGSRRHRARSALEAWPQAIAQSQSALPSFSRCW